MNLIEGEHDILTSPELTLTNLRVYQKSSRGSVDYEKYIFINHITGTQVTAISNNIWLLVAVISSLFFSAIAYENDGENGTAFLAVGAPIVSLILYYFIKIRVLTISSPSLKIEQRINNSSTEVQKFINCLHEHIAKQKSVIV